MHLILNKQNLLRKRLEMEEQNERAGKPRSTQTPVWLPSSRKMRSYWRESSGGL